MAHFWVEQQQGEPDPWGILSLDGDADVFVVTGDPNRPVVAGDGARPNGADAYVLRHRQPGGGEQWILFASADSQVYTNGSPLALGMRVLEDKDEIRTAGAGSLIFSTERRACVEPFPGMDRPAMCPRCGTEIEVNTPAVRCPGCGVWHHQNIDNELPCWTYAETCATCDQPTDLGTDFRWTPEGL